MKCVVTGAAGFIGSHLVDHLLARGHEVVGVDNFSTGRKEFLDGALMNPQVNPMTSPRFTLLSRDLLEPAALDGAIAADTEWVFHLSANADVRHGLTQTRRDLEQNTLVTFNVLEAMRRAGARRIAFSSTGSVYGEAPVIPTPETCPFPVQTSLYGASKLAGEALISAFAEGFGMQGLIFRFVSILGERYTHGHVWDFVRALKRDPSRLRILGDGRQRKSYLYVGDCIEAILLAAGISAERPFRKGTEIFNLGTDEYVDVDRSVDIICSELGVDPAREYSGGDRGWVGDNPFILLDCSRIRALGWEPRRTIEESVRITARDVLKRAEGP